MNSTTRIQGILDAVENWARENPYYYTDGKRFYRKPSLRQAKQLHCVGRYANAKEARQAWRRAEAISPTLRKIS